MQSPIFLIGTQRSGTTLLAKILSAHTDVFIKNEVPMLKVFTQDASREEIESRIDSVVKEQFGQSISQLLESESKSIWGLKDPQLTYHLHAIKKFFPGSPCIIIVRDARAVVNSYIENAWGLGTNCYTGALRWKREIKMQLAFSKEHPENTVILRFEDLINNQTETLQKICDFIEIPFEESMLDYASKKSFVSKNRQSINTFKAPDPKIIEKWKSKLNKRQIRVINSVCADLLEEMGYEMGERYKEVPGWLKLYYQLHQLIIGEIQIQYRWRFGQYKRNFRRWRDSRTQI